MKCSRRRFVKSTSLGLGASFLGVAPLAHGGISIGPGGPQLQGIVRSGNGVQAMPLPGAQVSLYAAGAGEPRLLARTTTDGSGRFQLRSAPSGRGSKGVFYATADLAGGLQLLCVIGPSLPTSITINELTTVAAGFAFAQFAISGVLAGDDFGLGIAAGMSENLVAASSGESSTVIASSPNGDETNSWRSTGSLANLLAGLVRHGGVGLQLFYALTTPPGGSAPTNLLQALSNLCRFPQQNVAPLFDLTLQAAVYAPALVRMPDAWTLVVKVNNTGDDRFLFGGPGNIAFDADGYAWITNNVVQGTGASSRFGVVLQPDGRPADGTRGQPKSPLLGGGLLGGGYGVGIARSGQVWFGNFGWGLPRNWPSEDGNGSVSLFTRTGKPISGPLGFQGGPVRAQAVVPDKLGNIWIASFGNDRIYVFLQGNPQRAIYFQQPNRSGPFDIEIAADGTAWVSNSGGLQASGQGSIARYALQGEQLRQIFFTELGNSNKALVLDAQGHAWLASGGDDLVYRVNDRGQKVGEYVQGGIENRGGMNAPWGITVDGDDNIWVGNFGPEQVTSNFTESNITKLAGSNRATRPPGLGTGDPISPRTGYTLPSAGAQVRLRNGEPLYGPNAPPSYTPLMRITSLAIDRAGNIWATNNWKPAFAVDLFNSGGDGICIFVGMAKPMGIG